ncbi:MAG: glycosyltransferase family 9 protein [Chitinophagaceae bacterium]|nr:glycosyltransferase family 9 protein [Chitinophagaceae bacterium]MCW5905316.1 glycosyltransferase family 9 protein [Chitinophagaceae bacterium]
MKLLIIRFSSIGDIVLTTPVVRCIKQQIPNVSIHYLTKSSFKGIVESNPYIDEVKILQDDWQQMITDLQQEEYDYVIDLHHNLRTLRVKKSLKAKAFSFNKLNIQKWLLTALKINLLPNIHIVDRNFETVKSLGVINDGKGLDYFIPEKDCIKLKDIPAQHQFGYIGIVIGAALNTKKMPVQKLQDLCSKIEYPIILLGGKEDRENGELIASIDNVKIYNACGKFNLNESADLVRKAKLFITHDTGLMHIAAAFKKPILSVWGNTVPAFGMTPYYGNNQITNIQYEVKVSCRPCSKIGYNKCPKKHFKCMMLQDVEQIAKDALKLV